MLVKRVDRATLAVLRLVCVFWVSVSWGGGPPNPTPSDSLGNTASGTNALVNNINGTSNTSGTANTAQGANALANNNGTGNTATGSNALQFNTSGSSNTAQGANALVNNTIGSNNTAQGVNALLNNYSGTFNTAQGITALSFNTNGSYNTASGGQALYANTTGSANTASGVNALVNSIEGKNNTAVGVGALSYLGYRPPDGGLLCNSVTNPCDSNIAVGVSAGVNLTNGTNNIYLGNQGQTTESGTIRIGTPGTHNDTYIPGTLHASVSGPSDARLKTNVSPLTHVLEKLEQLHGVSFEWNAAAALLAGHQPRQRDIGVIAQEVEAVFPELVTTWGEDGYKAVAYEKLTGVLIAAVKELKAETDTQQQHILALEARLAAMEQTVAVPQTLGRLSFSSLSAGWPLFGGLLLGGWVLRRRWEVGDQRT
jgi:hypothetical protein